MDLVPGASLHPVDGASPGVRDQGAAVASTALHDLGGHVGDLAGAVDDGQPGGGHPGDGEDAAIGEPRAVIEVDMVVEQEAIPGLIGPRPGPARSFQGRAGDDPLRDELGPDAVGQGFAVGVGDGQGGHPLRPVHLEITEYRCGHGL